MSGTIYTKEEEEKLVRLYSTYEYSYKELGKILNRSISSISCFLNRKGLKGKQKHNPKRKYPLNSSFFDDIDSEEKAYFLGFLFADGCNHFNNTKVSLSLKESDKEILLKLNNLIQPDKPLQFCIKKGLGNTQNQYCLNISNKRISNKLSDLGCVPRKTEILQFPSSDKIPDKFIRHFIRGYFDGDGWLGERNISVTGSDKFCNGLSTFLQNKFNLKLRIRKKGKVSELCFNRKPTCIFLEWIYKDSKIYLERKYTKYLKYYNN